MTPLREKLIGVLTVCGYTPATRKTYVRHVYHLTKYYRRSPDQLSAREVRDYLVWVVTERHYARSTLTVAINALRFFYERVIGWDRANFARDLPRPRQERRLPQIYSEGEIERVLAAADSPRRRALLMTIYACGLRVSEACHLKVRDIDSQRMTLRIVQGKGAKDRYVPLSPKLLAELRAYWRLYRPPEWLFPQVRDPHQPLDTAHAQKVYYDTVERARVPCKGGIHTLRHTYATHLLESGVDLPTLQRLLGHGSFQSTAIYLHLRQEHLQRVPSPLDLLAWTRRKQT